MSAPAVAAIKRLDELDALREEWDDLYRADPHAQVFLSFRWLRAFLQNALHPWSILTAREDGVLIAALPISLRGAPHAALPIAHELTFASAPFADYQGMLCRPGHDDGVIGAFAATLRARSWQRAVFPDVADPRIGRLAAQLGAGGSMQESPSSPCSAIDLPSDWAEFLAQLSKPTRRGLVQPLKTINEKVPDARFSTSSAHDADAHIEAMLHVNQLRWGGNAVRKARYTRILRAAQEQGCLRITILWDGERPIAGATMFLDEDRNEVALWLVGHDPEYGRASPGKALLAALIRDAIADGRRVLDFLRGDDAYKASFVNRTSTNVHYTVVRRGARSLLYRALEPGIESLRARVARLLLRRAA